MTCSPAVVGQLEKAEQAASDQATDHTKRMAQMETQMATAAQGHNTQMEVLQGQVATVAQEHRAQMAAVAQEHRAQMAAVAQEHRAQMAAVAQEHRAQMAAVAQAHETQLERATAALVQADAATRAQTENVRRLESYIHGPTYDQTNRDGYQANVTTLTRMREPHRDNALNQANALRNTSAKRARGASDNMEV